ncbi:MAG: VOC family protein [Desulfobacteraceae bacterium]|nr:VOC family protein [Desulfobacteraceae bacterium]MBU4055720.1 VOC family protein [Pseudomonadota bacterium]
MATYNGINHIAMITLDMDMTIRFWRDLLGMRLVAGLGTKEYRHYFFEISENDLIAFFEWPGVELAPEKDHGVPVKGAHIFDHISIGVTEFEHLIELKKKLTAAGFWVSEIMDHGFIISIYSFDPNHIPIEFSFPVSNVDIRKKPKMKDRLATKITLEGPDPKTGIWPEYIEKKWEKDDFEVYAGEGKIFSE